MSDFISFVYRRGDELKLRVHPVTNEIAPALYRGGEFKGWFPSKTRARVFYKNFSGTRVRLITSNPPEKES